MTQEALKFSFLLGFPPEVFDLKATHITIRGQLAGH